ncbi:cytochrome P450 [Cyathus striatus]|nr:cytochrome P450 [Cyathus striatus]
MHSSSYLVTGLLIILSVLLSKWYRNENRALPPGPKGWPLIGNLFDFMPKELWIRADQWAKQYGSVCYLHIFGKSVIFLNSPKAATELLERRGVVYSDRPKLTMAGELCGGDRLLPLMEYDDSFRRRRRLLQQTLGPRSIPQYFSRMTKSAHSFVVHLMNSPSDYIEHTRRYAGGLALAVVYGYDIKAKDDRLLSIAGESLDILANKVAAGSGIWMVDAFPFMKHIPNWLPGAQFKRSAEIWKHKIDQFIDEPFSYIREELLSGRQHECFCASVLSGEKELSVQEEDDIKLAANSMYAASAETTMTSISHFLLAMILHPHVFEKVQHEMDLVVGVERLPTFLDRVNLPFLECVMSEIWRWGVPVPINLPHCTKEDDIYDGMFIPKGSLVFANIWSMLRDENCYENASVFEPERFLNKELPDPRDFIFGFGRRKCPGADLVEESIWILLATMVSTLNIRKSRRVDGTEVNPVLKFDNTVFRIPNQFPFETEYRNVEGCNLLTTSTEDN